MKPAPKIEGSALFRALLEHPQPSDIVDYPRRDAGGQSVGRLRICLLRLEDHDAARTEGQHYVLSILRTLHSKEMRDQMFEGHSMQEVLGDAVARSLLAKACLTVDPIPGSEGDHPRYGRIFPDAASLRQLPAPEVGRLFNLYRLVQHKFGGIEASVTEDDVDSWVNLLMEGGETYPLERLPLETLAELTVRLAKRLWESRTTPSDGSSAAGSEASATSTSTPGSPAVDSSNDGSDAPGADLALDLEEVQKMSQSDAERMALDLLKKD